MPASLHLPVVDRSQAGEARRTAALWAERNGCAPDLLGRLALVVTELGNNLALHTAEGGCLLLRMLVAEEARGVEVLALDRGPGHANFGECLRDGYSTAGTSGTGLGAVRRASDIFEVHAQLGVGTALLSVLQPSAPRLAPSYGFGIANVPMRGETVCGDSAGYHDLGAGRVRVIVADGLGHGPLAAEASQAAVAAFMQRPDLGLPTLLESIHGALRATRGAAVAVAEVDMSRERVTYAGVGNIAGTLVQPDGATSSLATANGTAGVVLPRLREFTYPFQRGTLLIMTSDGIKSNWRLDHYRGLLTRHPSLIAGVLFRDCSRKTDDTTAAALRFCLPA